MCSINGGLLATSSMVAEVFARAMRVLRYGRAGVDLAATHDAAPAMGALVAALPDFYHRLVLGEVTGAELATRAGRLDHAAGPGGAA